MRTIGRGRGSVRYGGARLIRFIAVGAVLTMVTAACSSDGGGGGEATGQPKQGGQAVFGAEQWPQCVNPITS